MAKYSIKNSVNTGEQLHEMNKSETWINQKINLRLEFTKNATW